MSDITSQSQPTPLYSETPTGSLSARSPLKAPRLRLRQPLGVLRLWPAVVILALLWLALTVPAWVAPGSIIPFFATFIGSSIAAGALVLWWVFGSRLRWTDRLVGFAACVAVGAGAWFLLHPSVGVMVIQMYGLSRIITALVLWLLLTPFLVWPIRRVGLLVVLVGVCGYLDSLRFDGVTGGFAMDFSWRWDRTPEQKYLAERSANNSASPPANAAEGKALTLRPGDWPGFRGPQRDGRLTGVRLATDWKQKPPREVWRHLVGPGWSSFAVIGDRLYTQEQMGKEELVVCYDAGTGKQVWSQPIDARFEEPVAGPGPRATPTFHEGKIYALGASGKLACLDAAKGQPVWTRNILDAAIPKTKVPMWGFASSPLVAQGVVTVFVGGSGEKSVLGYKALSGEPAWAAGEGQLSYCSPHLARLGGVDQVLIATDAGLTAFHPTRGEVLWQHDWKLKDQARVVQPAVVGESDVLVGTGFNNGTRRVHVQATKTGWSNEEVWTTKAIKPYFNDLVIHQGHLYGFDNNFFTCVNLETGRGGWRARGYDNGQVVLLADQGLLLILTEKGEVALVEANPDQHKELGRFKAINGKTWNHPVLAHGKLFVRNGEEAACFQLTEETAGTVAGK